MKILQTTYNAISFNSKHKDTRKADDLMRKTNLAFPMFNPSYPYYFYDSLNLRKNPNNTDARINYINGICQKFIQEVRKPNEFMEDFELKNDIPHAYLLKLLKSKKMANCKESAILTLCALYANGYYTSQRVNLSFDYTITDKETKNELLKGEEDLDHSFVLTNFNNPKRKNLEDTIVVDSWLEYTGTLREANGKYKMLFGDIIDCKIQNIANEKNIDLKKCNVRINPFLTYTTKRTEQEAKRIGEYTRRTYPELIFD